MNHARSEVHQSTGRYPSRPHRSPGRTPTRTERRIIKVRVLRRWGPARIGYLLGIHPSTVHRVLTRYRLAKLRWLDRPTGRVVRRMEPARCGDMVHVDVKKLGKIPAGGGWRMLGRTAGNRNSCADKSSGVKSKRYHPLRGHHFLHTAIDGHSETHWFRWRLGLLDFDQGLVGPFCSVEDGFELCGR